VAADPWNETAYDDGLKQVVSTATRTAFHRNNRSVATAQRGHRL